MLSYRNLNVFSIKSKGWNYYVRSKYYHALNSVYVVGLVFSLVYVFLVYINNKKIQLDK